MSSSTFPPASAAKSGLPPSDSALNLLLEWPDHRSARQWLLIGGGSLLFHALFFFLATTMPSLIGRKRQEPPMVVHRIRLYLPPNLMTQKARNKVKPSKQIDLADLRASPRTNVIPKTSAPVVRRFELPKETDRRRVAKTVSPQILPRVLPQAPVVTATQNPVAQGNIPGTLPVAAPPPLKASAGPFQNIDDAPQPSAHPNLTPPKGGVQGAIDGLAKTADSRQLSVNDDVPEQLPLRPGMTAPAPTQHAAVELQSDPSGADFKAYLRSILTIVRANWRRVIPESARLGMLRGRTVVEFIINRDGTIPKLVTADSSGLEPLDRAAVAGLSMSNPLPPLPADFKGLQVRLAFTFAYNESAK